jgi:uncharacterized protein DUF6636
VRRVLVASLAAALTLAVAVPPASAGLGIRFFRTADNNVACAIVKGQKKRKKHGRKIPRIPGAARCDVRTHTWVAPPKPANCPLDWGNGVEVGDRGSGRYVCAGDTVFDQTAPVVGAGGVVAIGSYSCTALTTGSVRCTNFVTGSGFEVSGANVSLF